MKRDSIDELQETRAGITLFGRRLCKCTVFRNGIGGMEAVLVYQSLCWDHRIIPDTKDDLAFHVDSLGIALWYCPGSEFKL